MYRIVFYQKANGEIPVKEYMQSLAHNKSKDSRIKLNKIAQYIHVLEVMGTQAKEPYVKHLEGDIWELRPLRDRILFASVVDNTIVLLHCFMKQTTKTPAQEIQRAHKELQDYLNRE